MKKENKLQLKTILNCNESMHDSLSVKILFFPILYLMSVIFKTLVISNIRYFEENRWFFAS